MPEGIIDLANYCGCDGCQGVLTEEQRAEFRRLERERIAQGVREAEEAAERRRLAREERERELNQPFTCPECEKEGIVRDSLTVNENVVCKDCAVACSSCTNPIMRDEAHEVTRMWASTSRFMCDDCTHECYECGDVLATSDMYYLDGDYYCGNCSHSCDSCDERYVGEECENDRCRGRVRGLSAYGKTHPERWLGGPVRQRERQADKGYYLGFELEISADTGNVQPIFDWAQQNLGYSDAMDCKEDSSVEGFEIVSQPMTPAFFESVNWESFFDLINERFPLESHRRGVEPVDHGLHVHIGRVAFDKDDIAMASFCYLIGQGQHLERVGRRSPTTYCKKVEKPVSTAIKSEYQRMGTHRKQASKPAMRDIYTGRDAINLGNNGTIEIRAFRSTRKADDLRDAVRLVYVAAEYIRSLRSGKGNVSPRSLHWSTFAAWVGVNYPDAFASIAGITDKKVVR
jgi:hypothetical protein